MNIFEVEIKGLSIDFIEGILKFYLVVSLIILDSVFKKKVKIWVNRGYFVFLMNSCFYDNVGMVVMIFFLF